MSKENVLIWPRSAGIGDCFTVLAHGMVVFGEQPFRLVIGQAANVTRVFDSLYHGYYEDIFSSFKLCKDVEVLNCLPEDTVHIYSCKAGMAKKNIQVVTDHGWKISRESIELIRCKLRVHFDLKVRDAVKQVIANDAVNICFHLKAIQQESAASCSFACHRRRAVDVDKWQRFLLYLIESYENINLIGIGVGDPDSPSYLDPTIFGRLLKCSNFHLPYLEKKTVMEDVYCIANCDFFIGCNSGPKVIADFLCKPNIIFDFGYTRDFMIKAAYPTLIYQKMYWGVQSLSTMKNIFRRYWRDGWVKYGQITHTLYKKTIYEKYKAVVVDFLDGEPDMSSCSGWQSYKEGLYHVAIKYFEKGDCKKGLPILCDVDDYVDYSDKYQFYKIGRYLKTGGFLKEALDYLTKAIDVAVADNKYDIMMAAYFHCAEIYRHYDKKKKAADFYYKCLRVEKNHLAALKGFLETIDACRTKNIFWVEFNQALGVVKKIQKSLNILSVVCNNSRLWGRRLGGIAIDNPCIALLKKHDIIFLFVKEPSLVERQIALMNSPFKGRVVYITENNINIIKNYKAVVA